MRYRSEEEKEGGEKEEDKINTGVVSLWIRSVRETSSGGKGGTINGE